MYKKEIAHGKNGHIILMDSITQLESSDTGAIIVCGSHGGKVTGEIASKFALKAVFFNDAGVGKENAGIIALDLLQQKNIAAGTVAHTSARIGDALDMWEHGVISYLNEQANTLLFKLNSPLQSNLNKCIS